MNVQATQGSGQHPFETCLHAAPGGGLPLPPHMEVARNGMSQKPQMEGREAAQPNAAEKGADTGKTVTCRNLYIRGTRALRTLSMSLLLFCEFLRLVGSLLRSSLVLEAGDKATCRKTRGLVSQGPREGRRLQSPSYRGEHWTLFPLFHLPSYKPCLLLRKERSPTST